MKKTVNVNIGSLAFTLDEDAYDVLQGYLSDIRGRLPDQDRAEVLGDVESRLAEILRERTPVAGQVVDMSLVKQAMAVIGDAECFGERKGDTYERGSYGYGENKPPKKLYRSREHRAIAGVCGGLAEYMDWDITLTRLAAFLLMFLGGLSFWAYVILWIVLPQEPVDRFGEKYYNRKE